MPEAEYRVEEVRASKQRRQGLQLLLLEDPNKANKRNQVKKKNETIKLRKTQSKTLLQKERVCVCVTDTK